MSRLDAAPEILALAGGLGVGGAAPVDGILDHCRRRIDGWVAEAGGVTGIDALEALVTRRLQMVFEEVRADEDFDRITDSVMCRNVRLIRSPTFSVVFGTSCFQCCCIVPAMIMSVPWPTGKLIVSLLMLCLMRNFRVAPRESEPITSPIPGSSSACRPTLSWPVR